MSLSDYSRTVSFYNPDSFGGRLCLNKSRLFFELWIKTSLSESMWLNSVKKVIRFTQYRCGIGVYKVLCIFVLIQNGKEFWVILIFGLDIDVSRIQAHRCLGNGAGGKIILLDKMGTHRTRWQVKFFHFWIVLPYALGLQNETTNRDTYLNEPFSYTVTDHMQFFGIQNTTSARALSQFRQQ